MNKQDKIVITGTAGMVGSALTRILKEQGFTNLIALTRDDLDLRDQAAVAKFFVSKKPDYVFHLAAVVGGIHANATYPSKFIYDNTQMHLNVIHAAYENGVKKLLFPGSACTYPKMAEQPIVEESFLTGPLEPTNIAYAAAKINGIIAAQSYSKEHGFNCVVPMPTNAYGVGDNFNPQQSHVIPALIRRFHEAKINGDSEVVMWGSGKALREFLYVDDFAQALIFLMQTHNDSNIINLSTMAEISMRDLATKIAQTVGFTGEIKLDTTKPDGAPRKCLDSSKLQNLGWKPKVTLEEGLKITYEFFLKKYV
jgi:GDP-L-fucose synthase